MILVLIGVAIAVGIGAAVLLWPYGPFAALIGAAILASVMAFLAAVVLAFGRAQSGDERPRRPNVLSQIIGKRDRR